MRRPRALLALAGLCALFSAQARASGDPIEGAWTNSLGGAAAVVATSATHFVGTVTVAWSPGPGCSHPVGQTVWEFDKRIESDGIYRGTVHEFAPAPGCADESLAATWMVYGNSLVVCVNGSPCVTDTRLGTLPPPPPAPPPPPGLTVKEIGQAYRPVRATVANGATVTICNSGNSEGIPFSLSRFNDFNDAAARGVEHGVPKGVRILRRGRCMKLVARNPTAEAIPFAIRDALHSRARTVIVVEPSG